MKTRYHSYNELIVNTSNVIGLRSGCSVKIGDIEIAGHTCHLDDDGKICIERYRSSVASNFIDEVEVDGKMLVALCECEYDDDGAKSFVVEYLCPANVGAHQYRRPIS